MAIPPQPPRLTRADGSPIRVLAVDDEPSLTELLSMAMRYEGWDVTTADSGVHAVREAKATRPDVIVLDMMLPDFDGLEVMRRIRMDPSATALPGSPLAATTTSPSPSPWKRSSLGCALCCAARVQPSPSPTPP